MSKVIDYRIESSTDIQGLENKVNASLKEGWELKGELIPNPSSYAETGHLLNKGRLFQVMVRYSK